MRYSILAAGVAALAFTTPAMAQGQGNGNGKDKPAHAQQKGGRPDKARGNGNGNAKVKARGQAMKADNRGNGNGNGNDKAKVRISDNRGPAVRGNGNGKGNVRVADRSRGDYRYGDYRYGDGNPGLIDGCPPGLAKKGNGCMPPGQAKKLIGTRISSNYLDRRLAGPYATWFGGDDNYRYRMGDDYIYRIGSNNLINGLIPLYDRPGYYYPVGSQYPSAYDFYNVPVQYRSYYSDPYYRYGDGAIYNVDPTTQVIRSVVALLAGDLSVGQPLPNTYNVYNMPTAYRSQYRDTNDAWYRYNDGYVYRVDPATMLVTEAIKAII